MLEIKAGVAQAASLLGACIFASTPACSTINVYHDGATLADSAPIAPVAIEDGGAGSDQISVAYSGSILGGGASVSFDWIAVT